MIAEYINILWDTLDHVLTWLFTLLDSASGITRFGFALVPALVVMTAVFKYIISPYVTGSGSDKANQKKKGK